MAQATISIRADADLKRSFERLCHDVGMNMSTAFNVFMRQSVRKNRLPLSLEGDYVVTEEELLRRAADMDAGLGVVHELIEDEDG